MMVVVGMAGALRESADEVERGMASATVTTLTRQLRRQRFAQLEEIAATLCSGSYAGEGFRSPTDWLAVTTGESVGRCRTWIRWAERLPHLPVVREAFAAGELSESALGVLIDAWHLDVADTYARDEQLLVSWVTSLPYRDVKLVIDTWRRHADPDRQDRTAREQFERRALHVSSLWDGMGQLDGLLDPEGLALVREAIRVFSPRCDDDTRTAAQRRADGLVNLARTALTHTESIPGTRRRRPKVIATIALTDLTADGNGAGGRLDTDLDSTTVSSNQIRRMCCDAGIHRYVADPQGTVVDFGHTRRTVSDSQFDTLVIRDHGCRWPGCHIPAGGCDAHHADHWLDDGPTTNDNLILLCWYHHRLLHEQHWRIQPHRGGHFTLTDPNGNERTLRPPLVALTLPHDHPT